MWQNDCVIPKLKLKSTNVQCERKKALSSQSFLTHNKLNIITETRCCAMDRSSSSCTIQHQLSMLPWVRQDSMLPWVYLIENSHFTLSCATSRCIFNTLRSHSKTSSEVFPGLPQPPMSYYNHPTLPYPTVFAHSFNMSKPP